MYTLTRNKKPILEKVPYSVIYKYLKIQLDGGCSFGIDKPTLYALGYEIIKEGE